MEEEKTLKIKKDFLWKVAVTVLAVLFIASLLTGGFGFKGGIAGNAIKGDDAGIKVFEYLNAVTDGGVEYIGYKDLGNLYEVTVSYNEQDIPVYVTKDGEYFIQGAVPITGEAVDNTNTKAQPTEVPKSDKPVVELFVMSYCPYGTLAEKGIIPAIEALGNKIDFKLRFVYYAMHEKKEIDENVRQYCIQKEQPTKLLSYLKCFLKEGKSDSCLTEAGVDSAKLNSCVSSTDSQFEITANYNDKSKWVSGQYPPFDIDKTLNDKYGVRGSPTLVINGVQSNAGRDSASYLEGICYAFNTAPSECSQTLSTVSPSPGFGYAATSGSTVSDTQCG